MKGKPSEFEIRCFLRFVADIPNMHASAKLRKATKEAESLLARFESEEQTGEVDRSHRMIVGK